MIYGYARVSTDGQSVDRREAGCAAPDAEKVFRATASERGQRSSGFANSAPVRNRDVLIMPRLDRLARATRPTYW